MVNSTLRMCDDAFMETECGIYVPKVPVNHRDDEYDSAGFDSLRQMQAQHFWYRGRHRFLLNAVQRVIRSEYSHSNQPLSAIDLGAGCDGWIADLLAQKVNPFSELALGDSSLRALEYSQSVTRGRGVKTYQVDLLNLPWKDRWDMIFMLDVLEHIPDDVGALTQVHKTLRPGGFLFVTTLALKFFWSYNDDLSHHVRRYARRDFQRLANECGFDLIRSRYFMFFLSPLLFLSRLNAPNIQSMSPEQIRAHLDATHAVPAWPLNFALRMIFATETPLGAYVPFPWGTSILGVFRKPVD